MAFTPEIDAPQAGVLAAIRAATTNINAPQFQLMVPYNVPADSIKGTFAGINVPYRRIAQEIDVTQSTMMVVTRGKIDNPKLISWGYTMDGHDMYVLKLGTEGKTLVYDISTGQWAWWSSIDSLRWRASCGMNWASSYNIPSTYGSNVIVGDDSYGILWVLDPEKGLDDTLLSTDEVTFPRVATGQMITRDRNFLPVFSVNLTASLGSPALTDNLVTLEYSDDQGHSYVTADEPQVVYTTNYDQDLCWYSLGLVRAPGRIFRITDNGAFARIDGLDVNA
jgi:hypothetical protein